MVAKVFAQLLHFLVGTTVAFVASVGASAASSIHITPVVAMGSGGLILTLPMSRWARSSALTRGYRRRWCLPLEMALVDLDRSGL